jgi:hypothetical protein
VAKVWPILGGCEGEVLHRLDFRRLLPIRDRLYDEGLSPNAGIFDPTLGHRHGIVVSPDLITMP